MNANNSQIKSIVRNWERSYIEDVFVSSSENICPEGFENIINFEWPGTMHGCYCAATSNKASKLTKGSCDLKQVRKNCTTVDPIPKQKLTKFNGNIICVKRSNSDSIDLSVPTPTGECLNENHKVCGAIDGTISYQTCINKDLKCPITNFIIEDSESKGIQDTSNEKYQLGENKILFVSRNSSHFPVVQFKLTEGGPCIEEHEYDTTISKHFYKLLNKKPKGCKTKLEDGTLYDERFRYVDSISESDLLTQNNIFQELLLKPMNGNQSLSYFYTFNLYQRSYIEWNPKCDREEVPHQTYYILKGVDSVCWWQSLFNFVCLLNMVSSGLILGSINLLISTYNIFGGNEGKNKSSRCNRYIKWWEEMIKVNSLFFDKDETSDITIDGIIAKCIRAVCVALNKLATIFYVINIVLLLICIRMMDNFSSSMFQFTQNAYSDNYLNIKSTIAENNCSDDITTTVISSLYNSLATSRVDNMFIFKMTMLMLTFEVITYLTPGIVHLRKYRKFN